MVHRAISSLVRFPVLAQELSIPDTEAETEYERLLFEILKRRTSLLNRKASAC